MSLIYDGFASLVDGMNSGLNPMFLKETEYARGVNITSRGGFVATRPGLTVEKVLASGKFQGAGVWSLNSGDRIVFVVAGEVYVYDITLDDLTSMGSGYSATVDRCSFEQVDRWMVIQDGVTNPDALEDVSGTAAWYSDVPANTDPPTLLYLPGTVMKYAHGRLHYVPTLQISGLPNLPGPSTIVDPDDYNVMPTHVVPNVTGRLGFVSSDVRDNWDPQWVFRMSEHRVLNEGGDMSLPLELGYITAMTTMRNAATGTGVGALLVMARNGISAFDVSLDRAQWKATGVSIAQVLFSGSGTVSPYTVIPVNDDILYLDTNSHVRSLRYAKTQLAASSGALANTPMSNELSYFVDLSDKTYLPSASAAFADNRFLFTLVGQAGPYYKALGSYDVAQLYTQASVDTPSYDGVWTGFKFLQVLTAKKGGKQRLYAVVETASGNSLLILSEDEYRDLGTEPIEAQLVTKTMLGKDERGNTYVGMKRLRYCEFWLDEVKENVTLEVLYRAGHYPRWSLFGTKTIAVPTGSDSQSRRGVRIVLDDTTLEDNPITGENLNVGNDFQFAIKVTGACAVMRFQWFAESVSEAPTECETDNAEGKSIDSTSPGTELDDFSYEVTI